MTHAEIESACKEFQEFEKECEGYDVDRNMREVSNALGQVASQAFFLGYNSSPKWHEYFASIDIENRPDFPLFLKTLQLLYKLYRDVMAVAKASDSQVLYAFDVSRRNLRVGHRIHEQYREEKGGDPSWAWKGDPNYIPKPLPDLPPSVLPKIPLDNRTDIEQALIEMHQFWRTIDFTNESVHDFGGHIFYIGLSCSVLGYLPHPKWSEHQGDWDMSQTSQYPHFLEAINKVYRLFKVVEGANRATENQVFRCYRLQRRIDKIADDLRPILLARREAKNSP